jgi:tRNA(His) 5'-end guanylyltransferase
MTDSSTLTTRGLGDLERSALRFENYNDGFILPDTFLIVRLDAHRYGDWSELADDYPCGPTMTRALHATARDLMTASFRVIIAYTHGDEISLVIDPSENANPLRRSKIISTFASAAAIHFLKHSGLSATFDAKLSELPSLDRVLEYLFWQRRYCFRNATTIALRTALREHGHSREQRIATLASLGIHLTDIPSTTRRGALHSWETLTRDGREHFKLHTFTELPDDDAQYLTLVQTRLNKALNIPERSVVVEKPRHQHAQHKSAQHQPTQHKMTQHKITQGKLTQGQLAQRQPIQKQAPAVTQNIPANPDKQSPKPHEFKKNKKAQVSVFKMPAK